MWEINKSKGGKVKRAEESYICQQNYSRRSEKVEVGLEGPCELCCTVAAIWCVLVIDVLRCVASTRRRTSKGDKFIVSRRFPQFPANRSAQLSPESWGGSSKNSNRFSVGTYSKCNYLRERFPLLPLAFCNLLCAPVRIWCNTSIVVSEVRQTLSLPLAK